MVTKKKTVAEYLEGLDPDRRAVISKVRQVIRKNLPKGYAERVDYGMITWAIPLSAYPHTYNGQPLCYAGLAAHKSHNSLYLMGAYVDPRQGERLERGFKARGLKLDMGKSCLRFRTADDLPLDVIAGVIRSTPAAAFIRAHEAQHGKAAARRSAPRVRASR